MREYTFGGEDVRVGLVSVGDLRDVGARGKVKNFN